MKSHIYVNYYATVSQQSVLWRVCCQMPSSLELHTHLTKNAVISETQVFLTFACHVIVEICFAVLLEHNLPFSIYPNKRKTYLRLRSTFYSIFTTEAAACTKFSVMQCSLYRTLWAEYTLFIYVTILSSVKA